MHGQRFILQKKQIFDSCLQFPVPMQTILKNIENCKTHHFVVNITWTKWYTGYSYCSLWQTALTQVQGQPTKNIWYLFANSDTDANNLKKTIKNPKKEKQKTDHILNQMIGWIFWFKPEFLLLKVPNSLFFGGGG